MECVLVTRNPGSGTASPSTSDLRLAVQLGDPDKKDRVVTQLPSSEWAGAGSTTEHATYEPIDWSNRVHTLSEYSSFGSAQTNEFATWTQGRETFLASPELREGCEDDLRTFAERSDFTEGFMFTTSITDGFSGFSSVFLETLRDEFSKSTIFTTAMLSDALSWKRDDSERSKAQRLLNAAFSIQHLEDLSSMLLPIMPSKPWEPETPWAAYLRDDMPKTESYNQIVTMHLQSANSELREIDGLTSLVNQLNWRGDNKIAHLTGAVPLLPPDMLKGPEGVSRVQSSMYDFSTFREDTTSWDENKRIEQSNRKIIEKPFAEFSIVRGYENEELAELGSVLEASTSLKDPLAKWIALPDPFPVLPSLPPIFRSLIPSGHPLQLALPPHPDPLSPAGLMGLPNPLFGPSLVKEYYVQPTSIPILTTLSTSTAARHLLRHLATGIKELVRVRAGVLREYEEGEFGMGREGVLEVRERLETLADGLAVAGGGGGEREELDLSSGEEDDGGLGDEEDWDMD